MCHLELKIIQPIHMMSGASSVSDSLFDIAGNELIEDFPLKVSILFSR